MVCALVFAAIVTPSASGDDIVDVTISNLSFTGAHALVSETVSEAYQWDNSTASIVSGTFTFSTSGMLPTSDFVAQSTPQLTGNQVESTLEDFSTLDKIFIAVGAPAGVLAPGAYATTNIVGPVPAMFYLADFTCQFPVPLCPNSYPSTIPPTGNHGAFASTGAVTVTAVTAVPEPATSGLMLLGLGFLVVMRKLIAKGLPQAT